MPFFQKDDGSVFEVSEEHAEQVLRIQGHYKEVDVLEGEVVVEAVEVPEDVEPKANQAAGKLRGSKGTN